MQGRKHAESYQRGVAEKPSANKQGDAYQRGVAENPSERKQADAYQRGVADNPSERKQADAYQRGVAEKPSANKQADAYQRGVAENPSERKQADAYQRGVAEKPSANNQADAYQRGVAEKPSANNQADAYQHGVAENPPAVPNMAQGKYKLGMSQKYMNWPADKNYPDFTGFDCMVGRHLTKEMYEKCYRRVSPNGVTLDKVIQPSCDNTGRIIGLIAGDEESYDTFHEIFDAVIDEEHGGFGPRDKHPRPDLDASKLTNGLLDPKYVKSCRIRAGRGVKGLCFAPSCSRAERREVERLLVEALGGLSGDLAGTYYPLSSITPTDEQQLIDDHCLFQKPTGHLMVNSNSVRDWPDARGIWHNYDKTFLVWVNEEDHCRVISMQKDSNMQAVFERFGKGFKQIEASMKKNESSFMHSDRLGYLCACPSNIGTGLRCSVHLHLRKLSKHPKFEEIVLSRRLQARGTDGEDTAAVDDVYDVSNKDRLKLSERELVQQVIDGVRWLIELERRLEARKSIDDLLPADCRA